MMGIGDYIILSNPNPDLKKCMLKYQASSADITAMVRKVGFTQTKKIQDPNSVWQKRMPSLPCLRIRLDSLYGRRGLPIESEVPDLHVEYPIPPADDDEPDAPTAVPTVEASQGATLAFPELTNPVGTPFECAC